MRFHCLTSMFSAESAQGNLWSSLPTIATFWLVRPCMSMQSSAPSLQGTFVRLAGRRRTSSSILIRPHSLKGLDVTAGTGSWPHAAYETCALSHQAAQQGVTGCLTCSGGNMGSSDDGGGDRPGERRRGDDARVAGGERYPRCLTLATAGDDWHSAKPSKQAVATLLLFGAAVGLGVFNWRRRER